MFDKRTRRKRRKLFGEVGGGRRRRTEKEKEENIPRRKNYDDVRTEFPFVDLILSVEGVE